MFGAQGQVLTKTGRGSRAADLYLAPPTAEKPTRILWLPFGVAAGLSLLSGPNEADAAPDAAQVKPRKGQPMDKMVIAPITVSTPEPLPVPVPTPLPVPPAPNPLPTPDPRRM
ncbi:hypothetical protein GCM10022214_70860 [Actinomadura miaoliensis]|uniref:Uncharacterized protein n=1 Tax=Actinomadura miaoliensis TaxID=430685 RepID=A0ABP7WUU8_9ACTN